MVVLAFGLELKKNLLSSVDFYSRYFGRWRSEKLVDDKCYESFLMLLISKNGFLFRPTSLELL